MKPELITSKKNTHMGGNLSSRDPGTYSEKVWNYILENYNIQSMLDVGSGLGFTSEWFIAHGVNVISIEGLTENVINSKVKTIEHDLTKSPFILTEIDMVICIEVVEHICEQFLDNLLKTLCCGKFLLMTHAVPGQKGYHHVNCQLSEYWISHIESRGFKLLNHESEVIRELATKDNARWIAQNGMLFQKI